MAANERGIDQIISFGGAHSNHLHALAHAAHKYSFSCVAVVRAYKDQPDTPTLIKLKELGVKLHYASRDEYLCRQNHEYWKELQAQYGSSWIIPEGGANAEGQLGARMLAKKLKYSDIGKDFDYLTVASGTGTFLRGLALELRDNISVLGFLALNNKLEILAKLTGCNKVKVFDSYCFGGFAKITKELASFISQFERTQGLELDPV